MQKVMTADRETTWALHEHLIAAFESFSHMKGAESEEGLRFIDALMGFHNAHKRVILAIEERQKSKGLPDNVIRCLAVDTLIAGLGLQHLYPERRLADSEDN